jgi:hypothetical protein
MPHEPTQVNCRERISFYDQRIVQEKSSIHLAWALAGAAIVSGVVLWIFISLFVSNDAAKSVGTLGAGFVPLLAGFPIKDYLAQKAKISNYEYFRSCYETLHEFPEREKDMELDKLENIYWDLRKKLSGAS